MTQDPRDEACRRCVEGEISVSELYDAAYAAGVAAERERGTADRKRWEAELRERLRRPKLYAAVMRADAALREKGLLPPADRP